MKTFGLLIIALIPYSFLMAQNVGVGTTNPLEKLDVAGNIKADGVIINSGGSAYDFLMKSNSAGLVGFRKGHGGLGMNYIIAVEGYFPSETGSYNYNVTIVGEIKLFGGSFPPSGWMFCDGQSLPIGQYTALFSMLTFTYGGNGMTHFNLPDLRGAVPVGKGTSTAGYTWARGDKSN